MIFHQSLFPSQIRFNISLLGFLLEDDALNVHWNDAMAEDATALSLLLSRPLSSESLRCFCFWRSPDTGLVQLEVQTGASLLLCGWILL
jgi:hypothetical protein